MILINVGILGAYERFWPDLHKWMDLIRPDFELVLDPHFREPLPRVHKLGVERAEREGASHILFIEDDRWDFPPRGLHKFIEANVPHIECYSMQRRLPMRSTLARAIHEELSVMDDDQELVYMEEVPDKPPVQRIAYGGMGFCLVEMELLRSLKDWHIMTAHWPPDAFLCQAIRETGVSPRGHFDVKLPHGPVTFQNRWFHQKIIDIAAKNKGGVV